MAAVAARLESEFGRGFGEKNLRRMVQFAEQFPDEEIVAALLRQLGWTHFTLLLPIKSSLRREFYAEMCRIERWNTRTLLVFRDPYFLDFLGLKDVYAEKDLETAILREWDQGVIPLDRGAPESRARIEASQSYAAGPTTIDTSGHDKEFSMT